MLYYLLPQLRHLLGFFNVFQYITVRSGLAMVTAFMIVVLFGPRTIKRLAMLRVGQVIRDDGPETHLAKAGTPTMGGVLLVVAIVSATLLWADPANLYVITVLIVTCGFAAVGFADDYLKIRRKDSGGLRGRYKIVIEAAIALIALVLMAKLQAAQPVVEVEKGVIVVPPTTLVFPFLKSLMKDIGVFYLVFALVVILSSSNSVNLTDGLDGLAILPVVVVAGTYATFAYLVAREDASKYLYIPFIFEAGELTVFCGAIMGAGLGFLWYNCHPAEVFMGDVGALSLGGAIGTVAVVTKHELVLLLIGGIFVAEAASVILQVGYFKWTGGKRIFKMTPLHHHFEVTGWPENKVIIRFWIVQVLLALAGLSTLKLR
jgi:phospho-N-acetylmuramoyl-pentapeptide-transferase